MFATARDSHHARIALEGFTGAGSLYTILCTTIRANRR
jgi:hypothetical protein